MEAGIKEHRPIKIKKYSVHCSSSFELSEDTKECADQTDHQQQSDAGNGLPVLLLHQEEQAEGQSQRNQLGQNAIQNALDNDGAVAVLDNGSNGGTAVVGGQSTNDEHAQHGSGTSELLSVSSQDVDCLSTQIIRPVHQEEAASKLHDVEDQQEHDRTSKRSVYCHVRCDTCGDRNQSEPEDCVADTAQRTHSSNTHGTNGFDVSLLLLQREDDAHNEGNEEGVSIEELKVILKVGPALTFGLREALFSLSMMEKELVPEEKRANFIETLDQVMLASPANWEKHYHGDEKHLAQCRKYSYSDRARYYIGQPEVVAAMNKLFDNLREYPIPMNMLHQYMPISYAKIREGQLKLDPRELAMDGIVQFMLDYESAV